ncbi:lycopene cyclase family protein [Flavobacterium sp. SM15]|uniref:lycopene cyclase family protein n=1 Tax=Flavobacterium sp. SM15 TaxID=2908005 RepID=UPI001EDB3C52|nr:lycopene cyclase family protein [Flavobacterium sp. SM15]MCG2610460.1 lycopene cyclase family protein [Flavobacterium sp. SM15]
MKYDYIFSGAGMAALMILNEMVKADLTTGKNILVLEPSDKNDNDRTWCFWEYGTGEWDWAVSKTWTKGGFKNNKLQIECFSEEFKYKMIESKTFYGRIINELKASSTIEWKKECVKSFAETIDGVEVQTNQNCYSADVLFNSVFDTNRLKNNTRYPLLLQHFKGWFVKTTQPFFDSNSVVFMDFSVLQKGNTRFMYVLPVSQTEALVEYTLFSADVLNDQAYVAEIKSYLEQKGIFDYQITRQESGIIPMSVFPLWTLNSKRILNIGSAGGWTKASTGYTFKNSVKYSKKVVEVLKKNIIDFRTFYKPNRFTFYDSLFVSVLFERNELGYELFSGMFSKVKPELIFKFLDEKTTFFEELSVIWNCPKRPFLKALVNYILKK